MRRRVGVHLVLFNMLPLQPVKLFTAKDQKHELLDSTQHKPQCACCHNLTCRCG